MFQKFKFTKPKLSTLKSIITLLFVVWIVGNLSMFVLNISYGIGSFLYRITPDEDINVGYVYDDENIIGIEANISANVQSHWLSPSIRDIAIVVSLYNDSDYQFFQANINTNDIERNSNVDILLYGSINLDDLSPDFLNQTLLNSVNIRVVMELSATIGLLYHVEVGVNVEFENTFM